MWPQIKRKQACFYDLSTCFGVFSASALRHFVFSGGLRPFWDFLAFERPDGLSQAKKSQKGLRPPEKNKMSSSFSWKYSKKSWLIMKKCLLSFYLWSHIILTRILPWYYTFLRNLPVIDCHLTIHIHSINVRFLFI